MFTFFWIFWHVFNKFHQHWFYIIMILDKGSNMSSIFTTFVIIFLT
jgi:hypothetical protein